MAKKSTTTNTTLLRLKDTPFESASEMKAHEKRILLEEWENVERAKTRRLLLKKEENQEVIAPFLNGFQAKFTGSEGADQSLVRVYLTKEEAVQVVINDELKSKDARDNMETLVKSLTESFMNGYLTALGLKDEGLFQAVKKRTRPRSDD